MNGGEGKDRFTYKTLQTPKQFTMDTTSNQNGRRDITRIRLKVRAADLFHEKGLENDLKEDPSETVKGFCEMKNKGGKWVGGSHLKDFYSDIDPGEIVVWTIQIQGKKKGYKVALDLVRIRQSSSSFFDEVVQLGNKGAILAKAKSEFPPMIPDYSEPYELWFTITKTDDSSGDIKTKTYRLDPRIRPGSQKTSYMLIRSCIDQSGIPETEGIELRKLLDKFESANKTGNK